MAVINDNAMRMIGLGISSAGPFLPVGVHLRWFFDPVSRVGPTCPGGFVFPGFKVYRRSAASQLAETVDLATEGTVPASSSAEPVTFEGASGLVYEFTPAGLTIALPASLVDVLAANPEGTKVTLPGRVWAIEVDGTNASSGGYLRLAGIDSGRVAASDEATGATSGGTVSVLADRMDACRLTVSDGTFEELRYRTEETAIVIGEWTLIASDLAPINDWTVTSARMLLGEPAQLDGPTGAAWLSLVDRIGDLLGAQTGRMEYSAGDPLPTDTALTIPTAQLFLLASLDPAIARALGLLFIDTTAAPGVLYDYLLEGDYDDDTYYWICRQLGQGVGLPLPLPTNLAATATTTPRFVDGTGTNLPGGRVALTWLPPLADGELEIGAPVRYGVEWQALGTGSSPAAVNPAAWTSLFGDMRVVLTPTRSDEGTDWSAVGATHTYASIGWHGYRILGIDLFGRATAYVGPATAEVVPDVNLPPPASLRARYLATDDPGLTAEESTWVTSNGTGLLVSWAWTRENEIQAPQVVEFRIYTREKAPDRRTATASGVTDNGDGTYTVATDLNLASVPGNFEGGTLLSAGVRFPISSHTSTATTAFVVKAVLRLDAEAGSTTAIGPSAGDVTVMEGIRKAASWDERVYVQAHDLTPVSAVVSAISEAADGLYDISCTAVTITGGAHAGPGVVYDDTVEARYAAVSHVVDGSYILTGMRIRVPVDADGNPTVTLPSVGHSLDYYPGYRVFVDDVTLTVSGTDPVVTGFVGVSTVDGDTSVADDPRWASGSYGSRTGNEGVVSSPVMVYTVWRTAPDAPTVNALTTGLAGQPDYDGRSKFTVSWPDVPGYGFHLLRATVEAIVEEYIRTEEPEDTLPDDLEEADILALAAPGSMDAFFTPVNKERIGEANVRGSIVEYEDDLPGSGNNRYLYRVVVEDMAGNRGEPSLIPTVVYIPLAAPKAPRIVKTLGGDMAVTVHWRSVREARFLLSSSSDTTPAHRPELTAYRVFRATSATDAQDTRLMTLVTTQAPTVDAATESYSDTDVTPGTTYYYRVTAVVQRSVAGEDEERESAGSNVSSGSCYSFALPGDVTWDTPTTTASSVALSWTPSDTPVQTLVQRTVPGFDSTWVTVSTWLPAGTYTYTDTSVSTASSYTYRVRLRNVRGFERVAGTTLPVTTP